VQGQPRNCEERQSFEDCKQQLLKQLNLTAQEFDEAYLFPMQQLIVYNPAIYPEIENTGLHVFATDATPRYPSIFVAYTFDDERVSLWYAELNEVANGQES